MLLELLRRSVKEYDRLLVRAHIARHREGAPAATAAREGSVSSKNGEIVAACPAAVPPFRPGLLQQAVRALLHMFQFAVAYFVML